MTPGHAFARAPQTLGEASDFVVLYTGDVSAHGAFIVSDTPLPVDRRVHVEISFPGLLAPHRLTGVVRWSKDLKSAAVDELPGFGVEWTETPHSELLRALGPVDRGATFACSWSTTTPTSAACSAPRSRR